MTNTKWLLVWAWSMTFTSSVLAGLLWAKSRNSWPTEPVSAFPSSMLPVPVDPLLGQSVEAELAELKKRTNQHLFEGAGWQESQPASPAPPPLVDSLDSGR